MGFFRSICGMVEAEVTSADPAAALRQIGDAGITIFDVKSAGELTFRFRLRRWDYKALKTIARKRGDSLRIISRSGLYWTGKRLLARPVLLIGLAFWLLVSMMLPSRIFFVQVEGNKSVSDRLIIEKAAECGLFFGSSRRAVRSEKMKNALLSVIPELQWAGVNTKGCIAVISVREKTQAGEKAAEPAVSSIVACRDGIVVSCTVEKGSALCRAGQAVQKGEILVSGYTDCGLTVRVSRAVGEIFGQTRRNFQAVTPKEYDYRGAQTETDEKLALIIGKKRINFYKDSGILGTTCDKMSTVNYLTLPGGFTLPLALVTERWVRYDCQSRPVPEDGAERILKDFASNCLKQQMVAGRILRQDTVVRLSDGVYRLDGDYACLELIGVEQSGELLENYGKDY